jgi:hypothetical protein
MFHSNSSALLTGAVSLPCRRLASHTLALQNSGWSQSIVSKRKFTTMVGVAFARHL